MEALHVHEVVLSMGNFADETRRRMKVGPTWPGTKPANGESIPVFDRQEPAVHVGGEHRYLQTSGGHPASYFVHVCLNATEQWRKPGGNHGDTKCMGLVFHTGALMGHQVSHPSRQRWSCA